MSSTNKIQRNCWELQMKIDCVRRALAPRQASLHHIIVQEAAQNKLDIWFRHSFGAALRCAFVVSFVYPHKCNQNKLNGTIHAVYDRRVDVRCESAHNAKYHVRLLSIVCARQSTKSIGRRWVGVFVFSVPRAPCAHTTHVTNRWKF